MSIYGNYFNSTMVKESVETAESLFAFINESNNEIDSLFSNILGRSILKEEETTALDINRKYVYKPEEAKKTVIEKIKELFERFVNLVKTTFKNLADALQKKYLEINAQDQIFSKFKDIVTFDNLKKAREKGWKGIPDSLPSVCKIASAEDSALYKSTQGVYTSIDIENDIDPIITAQDYKEAKGIYDKFKKKLDEFKSDKSNENQFSYLRKNGMKVSFTGDASEAYFVTSRDSSYKGYYYPFVELFAINKKLAEDGEKYIKQYKFSSKAFINKSKVNNVVNANNMKSYKGKGVNVSNDPEVNKIMALYYKAKYETAVAYIDRSVAVLRAVVAMLKTQHIYAMRNYALYVAAIKRYVKPEKTQES